MIDAKLGLLCKTHEEEAIREWSGGGLPVRSGDRSVSQAKQAPTLHNVVLATPAFTFTAATTYV